MPMFGNLLRREASFIEVLRETAALFLGDAMIDRRERLGGVPECRMGGHVVHPLAADIDPPSVANALEILAAGHQHGIVPTGVTCGLEPRSSLRRSRLAVEIKREINPLRTVEAAEAHQWLVGHRKQL